jgi:DNA invertase Pin-like site-specific DNA recombinase
MKSGLDAVARDSSIVRAARYGRRSTGDQENSIAIQFEAIDAYAAIRGVRIVRTYVDDGISGLSIDRREALQDLIEDVQSGRADFTVILVYDVSRWGRFQDVDESAYYEFICRKCGVAVHYCAELFQNDGSFFAAIGKGLKRAMAADQSRDLSVKVFAGHVRLAKRGYSQGGSPGYGLRRVLVDQTGAAKFRLAPGEHKAIATDRIVFVPGPPQGGQDGPLDIQDVRGQTEERTRDRPHPQSARTAGRQRPLLDAAERVPHPAERALYRQLRLE